MKTFGKQGLNHSNISQAIFVYVKIIMMLKEEGGRKLVDAIHSIVMEKLLSSRSWQREGEVTNVLAFGDLWKTLMEADLDVEGTAKALEEILSEHTRNIKSPNFARWFTILPALKVFLDN